jgi:hypothetical protein
MLIIEPRNPGIDFAGLVQVRIDEPSRVSLDRLRNRLDHAATLHIEGVRINLHAGPEALQFCRDLLSVAEEACSWAEGTMCEWCEEDVRLAEGRYCPDCEAKRPWADEHLEADNQMRAREARAERGEA